MTDTARPRRTQAERTEQTRKALIEATIRAIRDDGYRATTTRRVAEYAGVSLGAMAHHFPNRSDLVAAALDEVAAQLIATIESDAGRLGGSEHMRSADLLDALWRSFTGEWFLVWLRVWFAAADDADLHDAVLVVDRRMSSNLARVLPPLAPEGLSPRDWMRRINVALDAIRGLSLLVHFQPRREETPDRWPATRSELVRLLDR